MYKILFNIFFVVFLFKYLCIYIFINVIKCLYIIVKEFLSILKYYFLVFYLNAS